jgi:hypothetical protein
VSTAYPSQRITHWVGSYAAPANLPGVGAAEVNLQAKDIAYVTGIGLYVCTNATFPATWVADVQADGTSLTLTGNTLSINAGGVSLAKLTAGLQRGVPSRTTAAAITVGAADMGGVIHASAAGAQACDLPTMVGSLVAGFDLIFEIAQDGAATQVTVTPNTGVVIDGVGGGTPTVLTAGRGRRSFGSSDGLNWLTKAV